MLAGRAGTDNIVIRGARVLDPGEGIDSILDVRAAPGGRAIRLKLLDEGCVRRRSSKSPFPFLPARRRPRQLRKATVDLRLLRADIAESLRLGREQILVHRLPLVPEILLYLLGDPLHAMDANDRLAIGSGVSVAQNHDRETGDDQGRRDPDRERGSSLSESLAQCLHSH